LRQGEMVGEWAHKINTNMNLLRRKQKPPTLKSCLSYEHRVKGRPFMGVRMLKESYRAKEE